MERKKTITYNEPWQGDSKLSDHDVSIVKISVDLVLTNNQCSEYSVPWEMTRLDYNDSMVSFRVVSW